VPGLMMHEGLRGSIPDKFFENLAKEVPMNRPGRPEEIAEAAAFFMSEGSSYVTGQTMHVNGGLFLPG
jgi:3-oxoacyl-[acyl-carrier protein] reductase